jgi:hypothetical protein
MFDLELQFFPQLIEDRQSYLRSLAGHRTCEVAPEPLRLRAGRALVRLGQWVEGGRPDAAATILPSLPSSTPRLAGSAK